MSNVFDAISSDDRDIIMKELQRRNPILLAELLDAENPTHDQSGAVVSTLIDALSENYGPGHIPNEYGMSVDNAIGAYLLAWPMYD